jgi:hypothetical protein
MSASAVHIRPEAPAVAIAVVVGALTSPFIAVYTIAVGTPIALVAWAVSRRRPHGDAGFVAAVVGGLVLGAALYFLLAVAVSLV